MGRVVQKGQTDWAEDDEIDIFRQSEGLKYPTKSEYDAIGRMIKVILPQGYTGEAETSIKTSYNDPWEVITTHSVGRSKRTIKNARGQVLYIEDYGTGDNGEDVSAGIGFAYDLPGRRIKKMDLNSTGMGLDVPSIPAIAVASPLNPPEGDLEIPLKDNSGNNIAYWWYDGFGQVVASNDPDLGFSRAVYNSFGEVISATDANSRTVTMKYDMLGRVTEKVLPDGDGIIKYEYDQLTGKSNTLGRLVSIDDPSQRKEFDYDEVGRIVKESRDIKVSGSGLLAGFFETTFEYDLLNRRKMINYPKDPVSQMSMRCAYDYGPMGVTGIKVLKGSKPKNIVSDVKYNEFGQMLQVSYGNGSITQKI